MQILHLQKIVFVGALIVFAIYFVLSTLKYQPLVTAKSRLQALQGANISVSFQSTLTMTEDITSRTSVVTTTYYPDLSDIRFNLALELCNLAAQHHINLIIVDGSPDHTTIREQFQKAGSGYVHVYQQDTDQYVGKGGSLRQAILKATEMFKQNNIERKDAAICFTEPEKVDLMNHIHTIVKPILDGKADVIVPTRNDELFRETYPIEQYHSESFGNGHFNLLAKQFDGFGEQKLDWLFGPFVFKASLASSWLNYTGTSWDAQMIPYVRGVRNNNWRIMPVTVNFKHPREMKEQEEGDSIWTTKRLHQLNLLFDLLGKQELSP